MNVIDLDSPQYADAVLYVAYGGTKILVNKARLLDMIRQEQQFLNSFGSGGAPGQAPTKAKGKAGKTKPSGKVTDVSGMEHVTHASLSYRIKKIFTNAEPSQRLRGAHVSILTDLIRNFDWKVPAHPNTRLELHLLEMAGWADTPATLKKVIDAFLERYSALRRTPSREVG